MNFVDAIKSVYSNYANFNGRACRSEFWWFTLFNFIMSIIMGLTPVTDLIWSLGNLLPSLAVACRRLHDIERSGWWQLLPLAGVPIVLLGFSAEFFLYIGGIVVIGLVILLIVWYATKGTDGPNRFGDDPLGGIDADVFT